MMSSEQSRFSVSNQEDLADELFDTVSEALRDHRNLWESEVESRVSLQRADEAFQQLHEWIIAGRPLPGPWRKRFSPIH